MKIIVKDWQRQQDGRLKVFYSTWDGHCICTKQNHSDFIQPPSKKDFEKRDVHIEVLKQLYNK